jgi:hypothetical protein
MTQMKMLLFVAGALCLASPVRAETSWNPWMQAWTCSAFEYAKRCNAEWSQRTTHCRCITR